MILESKIKELVDTRIEGTNLFLVNISISASNKIDVLIDGFDGVSISDCVNVSRGVEHNLDRENEDFSLEVSSAGLDTPFTVSQQYEKNLGREVKVYTCDGRKHEGELIHVDGTKIKITYQEKVKIEGRKKKEWVTRIEEYFFECDDQKKQIKDTKVKISFK